MPLTLRSEKGSALTHSEMDGNWEFLRDRINALEALYNLSWNSDGTLKDNKVTEGSLQNRIVSTNKRKFASNFYYAAGGTANAIVVTNSVGLTMAAYANETVLYIKTGAAQNTGPVTLQVDALSQVPVIKATGVPLVSGDLPANSIVEVVYVDGSFYLTRATPTVNPLISGIDTVQGSVLSTALTTTLQKVGTINLTKPTGTEWKHVRVMFSTQMPRNVSGMKGAEFRIGSDVLALKAVGDEEINNQNADDSNGTTIIAEGFPTDHETEDVIAIDIYLRTGTAPYDVLGDDTARRRMSGAGYYGPA